MIQDIDMKESRKESKEKLNSKLGRTHFSVANRIISTSSIIPLESKSKMQSKVDRKDGAINSESDSDFEMEQLFSPVAPDYDDVGTFEEDAEFDWMFPSMQPKRFGRRGHMDISKDEKPICDNLESILDVSKLDVEIPTNKDFWKAIDTGISEACVVELSDGESLTVQPLSENANEVETPPKIEDFITTDNSSNITVSEVNSRIFYPIKRFTFRDADGKLALDPFISTALGHENMAKVSKPRRKLRNVLSTKAGWCEMVCTGVGIGEFMLL